MQGVIVTPSSDVWVLGISKNQLVYIPKGDPSKAKLLCEGFKDPPCKSLAGPFHLGIDQQDRIWVTNALGRLCHPLSRLRSHQGRDLQDRLQRQRPRDRQPGQCLGDEPFWQFRQRRRCSGRRAQNREERRGLR